MHNGREGVASGNVDIRSLTHVLNDLAEVDKVRRIENAACNRRHAATRAATRYYRGTRNRERRIVAKYIVSSRGAHESAVVLCEPIDAEFLVVSECQLPNHCAQRHLRRLNVHFVQNLFHLRDYLAIAEHDD